jgi:XTP/dITP diphosphohydrolase
VSARFVLATANPDKAAEIEAIFAEVASVELIPRPHEIPDVEESGDTLVENARLKAVALSQATGLPALADDTGLFVDALDSAPGVYSARYAGEDATYTDNVEKLLASLGKQGAGGRTARFTTVALVSYPDGTERYVEGSVEGVISTTARGTNGFGYDPVFAPTEGDGRTFAEMTAEEKHAISHRGRAFRGLAERLADEGLLA